MAGTLIISLDFELFWGVRDVTTIETYGGHIRGVREAIPAILRAFEEYRIRATWATVGLLFFDSKRELLGALPARRPTYANAALSPYPSIDRIGEGESDDPYHFGKALVEAILACDGQEVGSHTFSHYYALERGQTAEMFRDDLGAAVAAAKRMGIELRSLVFPRNQYNVEYVEACRDAGITSYRGNEASWMYRASSGADERAWKRGARLIDTYVNMSGHHTYSLREVAREGTPYNLPASRFLRPWSSRLRHLEEPRLRRIERAMTRAARNGEAFHLWWHPHNFGANLENNMTNLRRLLSHFDRLRVRYEMESASMGDVALRLATGAAEKVGA